MKKNSLFFIIAFILISLSLFSGCVEETNKEQNYLSTIDSEGLIGYWRFDKDGWSGEEDEVVDSSGFNNHGTIYETVLSEAGKIGNGCAQFDGIDDYIIVSNDEVLEPHVLSIELWVRKTGSSPFEYLLSKGAENCDFSSYAFHTDGQGRLSFYVRDEMSTIESATIDETIWDGTWHFIVGTFDGTNCRLYIDGAPIHNYSKMNSSILYNLSTHNNLYFGTYDGTCSHPFRGELDEILLWNKALNETEIMNHYLSIVDISKTPEKTSSSLFGLRDKIREELTGLSYSDLAIIKGSNLTIQEKLLMFFAQQQLTDIDKIEVFLDNEINNISEFSEKYQKLIFLGGNHTNDIVYILQSAGAIEIDEEFVSPPFYTTFAWSSFLEKEIIIFSTGLETSHLQNNGPERSPLRFVIDKRLTPIVATITSITLIHVGNVFGSTISEFFFDFTSEKLGERKKKKHQFKQNKKTSLQLRLIKEVGSILIAIIIFSLSLSWTWSVDLSGFSSLFVINIFVVSIFYLIREGLRVYYSKKFSLTTEHVFWPLGSVLTFLSTLLGNTFSLASYTALENEEKEQRYSNIYFIIFSILFILTLITFILNIFLALQMLQMFYVFTIMAVFIDMTPIQPMDGYELKKYNGKKWTALYIPVLVFYIIIMFSSLL